MSHFRLKMLRSSALVVTAAAAMLAGCERSDGLSSGELKRAAEQRVREKFNLAQDLPLSTETFVGNPRNGDVVICGTVKGAGAHAAAFPAQRFVAATDPARWLKFQDSDAPVRTTQPDKFVEWEGHCMGERGDNGDEPLAVTEVAEDR